MGRWQRADKGQKVGGGSPSTESQTAIARENLRPNVAITGHFQQDSLWKSVTPSDPQASDLVGASRVYLEGWTGLPSSHSASELCGSAAKTETTGRCSESSRPPCWPPSGGPALARGHWASFLPLEFLLGFLLPLGFLPLGRRHSPS